MNNEIHGRHQDGPAHNYDDDIILHTFQVVDSQSRISSLLTFYNYIIEGRYLIKLELRHIL